MNSIVIVGNLGKDAELKIVGESAVLKWSVAVTEKWKDKGGEQKEKTNWFNCELWGPRAKSLSSHLTKGTKLAVRGSVDFQTYEKDGTTKYFTVLKVQDITFAGGGKQKGDADESQATGSDDFGDDQI